MDLSLLLKLTTDRRVTKFWNKNVCGGLPLNPVFEDRVQGGKSLFFPRSSPLTSLQLILFLRQILLNIIILRETHHPSHFIKFGRLLPIAYHPWEAADSTIPRRKEKALGLITLQLSAENTFAVIYLSSHSIQKG